MVTSMKTAVNVIMKDLIKLMDPKYIEVWGKFTPRGGISIDPYCNYGRPDTKWEQMAEKRMLWHDMYPEKIDNAIILSFTEKVLRYILIQQIYYDRRKKRVEESMKVKDYFKEHK